MHFHFMNFVYLFNYMRTYRKKVVYNMITMHKHGLLKIVFTRTYFSLLNAFDKISSYCFRNNKNFSRLEVYGTLTKFVFESFITQQQSLQYMLHYIDVQFIYFYTYNIVGIITQALLLFYEILKFGRNYEEPCIYTSEMYNIDKYLE